MVEQGSDNTVLMLVVIGVVVVGMWYLCDKNKMPFTGTSKPSGATANMLKGALPPMAAFSAGKLTPIADDSIEVEMAAHRNHLITVMNREPRYHPEGDRPL